MDAALVDVAGAAAAPPVQIDGARVRDIILFRIAFAGRPSPRDGLAKELAPLTAHVLTPAAWAVMLDRDLAALADAGLIELKPSSVSVTEPGSKRAAMILGGRGAPPRTWVEARDIRLVAKALGLDNEPPARLKPLAKPDGLRAALVVKSFKLKIRGAASPTRLRTALAQIALARAFGNQMKTSANGKQGLSAKAARTLAGQLSRTPQDFRTDARLIAALAADYLGLAATDHAVMQLAVLRSYVTKGAVPDRVAVPAKKKRKAVRSLARTAARATSAATRAAQPELPFPEVLQPAARPVVPLVAIGRVKPEPASGRPDLEAFAAAAEAEAQAVAEGWAGNRKALISRVWQRLADSRRGWGLTEIEFKCMLTEAHRLGRLVLTTADLKDGRQLREFQASAVAYRNAVFHFLRVDD